MSREQLLVDCPELVRQRPHIRGPNRRVGIRQVSGTHFGVAKRRTGCYAASMSKVIPQRELRNQNAAVIAAVAAGESFVITRNGAPVAELRPVTVGRRRFVPKAEVIAAIAGSGHIDPARFRADLDRVVDSSL